MWLLTGHQPSRDEARRTRWVTGLLRPACPDCQAPPGGWCDDAHEPPAEMARIDRNPARFVHSTRIVAAVTGRHVSRSLTIAQFAGGPVAAGLPGIPTPIWRRQPPCRE